MPRKRAVTTEGEAKEAISAYMPPETAPMTPGPGYTMAPPPPVATQLLPPPPAPTGVAAPTPMTPGPAVDLLDANQIAALQAARERVRPTAPMTPGPAVPEVPVVPLAQLETALLTPPPVPTGAAAMAPMTPGSTDQPYVISVPQTTYTYHRQPTEAPAPVPTFLSPFAQSGAAASSSSSPVIPPFPGQQSQEPTVPELEYQIRNLQSILDNTPMTDENKAGLFDLRDTRMKLERQVEEMKSKRGVVETVRDKATEVKEGAKKLIEKVTRKPKNNRKRLHLQIHHHHQHLQHQHQQHQHQHRLHQSNPN